MLIRFMGPGCVRRIVDGVEFSREAGMVQEVSEELGAALVMTEEFDYAELHGDEGTGDTDGRFGFDEWVEEIAEELEGDDLFLTGDLGEMVEPEAEEENEEAEPSEDADQEETDYTVGGLTKRG